MIAPALVLRASELSKHTESLDSILGVIPRGALTEIAGPASSGKTSFLCSLLASVTSSEESSAPEYCALIDAENTFDPASAAAAGARLSQLLWVQCNGNVEHALRAADLLAQAGGFGLVVIDLAGTPSKIVRRIPLAVWFRLRHAVEHTKTALISVAQQVHASSSSALKIEFARERIVWQGRFSGTVLDRIEIAAKRIQNHRFEHQYATFWR